MVSGTNERLFPSPNKIVSILCEVEKMQFPLILSGPIVRRVESTRAYIWIATSKKVQIESDFFQIEKGNETHSYLYHKLDTNCQTMKVKIGKQLFVYLIKITPQDESFPTDTLIGYNLRFNDDSRLDDLESLELLNPNHPGSLVYGNLKYPTFQIKRGQSSCHIFYGSCRKLHGDGEDTLAYADSIIDNHHANVQNRPDSLFLMGDQIYADDVADPLFGVISKISNELIGQREPLHHLEKRLQQEPFCTALNQVNGRQLIMESFCQFTSSHAQNHLIEFGEFAAMYLLSWSPEIWDIAQANHFFESFDELEKRKLIHFVSTNEKGDSKNHRFERNQLLNRFNEQQEALVSFRASLNRVRRLLANIPTYMIFDDHDLTDDWNISAEWKKNVSEAPLGRHVIANGLSAYWAFQGWGNDPDNFDQNFIKLMESYFKTIRKGSFHPFTHEKWGNILWQLSSWHFVAPTHPKAVFLDTRTQREYTTTPKLVKLGHIIKETTACPQLLSDQGWSTVSNKLLSSSWKTKTPLLIVSATPVYGMGLIESFLHDYVYPFQVIGVEVRTSFDFEAWKYNGEGFTKLLYQVAKWEPSECIFLSGDVHYASAVKATVTFPGGTTLPIHQYTSSPFKNMSFSGVWGVLMKGVIGFNSIKRKNKDIYRICDTSYSISHDDKDDDSKPFLWKDQLRYQFLEKGSIIETNNNLGLVSISSHSITNVLIKELPEENK